MAKTIPIILSLICFCFVLSQTYLTETAEDIMECWKNNSPSLNGDTSCTKTVMKDTKYKCCYIEKTERTDKMNTVKSCVRLYNDEETLRDYYDRLRDDFSNIQILCSAQALITTTLITVLLFLLF